MIIILNIYLADNYLMLKVIENTLIVVDQSICRSIVEYAFEYSFSTEYTVSLSGLFIVKYF